MWNLVDGKLAWKQSLLWAPPGVSPVFAPDGRTLAVGDGTQVVHLCDAATGRRLHGGRGHEADLTAVALSPDGRLAAMPDTTPPLYGISRRGKYFITASCPQSATCSSRPTAGRWPAG